MSDITQDQTLGQDQTPGEDQVQATPAVSSIYDELPDAPPARKLKFTVVERSRSR